MTELYIVRHGRTAANAAGLKQGIINTPNTYLNDKGKQQAQQLAAAVDFSQFSRFYTSPLVRTKQTTEILNQTAHLPVQADPRLLEISYGDWDGQPNVTLMAHFPAHFDPIVQDVYPTYTTVAQGERFEQVEARVQVFTLAVVKQHPHEKIVIVTHGFTVRSFAVNATHAHGLEILEPDNCSMSKIIVDPQTFDQHLVYYNRVFDNRV